MRFTQAGSVQFVGKATGTSLDTSALKDVILDGIEKAPAIFAEVIARAADEPDLAPQARLLPLGVQVEAIGEIVRLTLKAEGGVEKFSETVTKLARSLSGLVGGRAP